MKSIHIFLSAFFMMLLILGCSKETTPSLVYPTSFVFNTPSLEERSVYVIDSSYIFDPATSTKKLIWNFRRLGDTLGSYDKSNPDIADTLNFMIRNEFADPQKLMISKITLLSSTEMELEYSLLIKDALNPLNDTLEFIRRDLIEYQQVGNILARGMYINNDFREIYICNEFILATKTLTNTTTYQEYYKSDCNGPDPTSSLGRFVTDYPFIKYDTASVEYVNYIFSSYK